jgi:pimeloyl-ACP methyl ester carboxylesterase
MSRHISCACRYPTRAVGVVLVMALLTSGCMFQTVREQQAKVAALCTISGTVRTELPSPSPLIVGLLRHTGGDVTAVENFRLVDHFVVEGSALWFFKVSPGTYGLAAFADLNADLIYQPGEPFLRVDPQRLLVCASGEELRDIALVIPEEGRPRRAGEIEITKLQAHTVHDQLAVSVGLLAAVGAITTLDDPRFSPENAASGMWAPFDFVFNVRPGVYFLQAYDPHKIPVLFVHGIQGTPRSFRFLIEHLDADTFQPWVAYYPSGASLSLCAEYLSQMMDKLRLQYGVKRLVVVAHSMGGLVARGFILRYLEAAQHGEIPLFVTLATPWGGHQSAARGVRYAPAVVRSWYDMAPDSRYVREIFYQDPDTLQRRRTFPRSLAHHLLFAFNRNSASFGASDDRVVTVASQLRAEAQREASRLYGFDLTHTSMLEAPEVAHLLNEILASAAH